jgi:16S rRNA (guanine(966)-N(2))-methyltransferase RsmD
MRVIAGELRGRRLRTRKGPSTRPTSERARAGLFDCLGPRIPGARVLDLFAGNGCLGIEALSRGAASATFVERDRAALSVLRANLADLGLAESSRVLGVDVQRAMERLSSQRQRFDVIVADPPYGGRWAEALLACEALSGLLRPGGSVILERSVREPRPMTTDRLHYRDSRTYGETRFDWYEPMEEPA